MSKFMGWLREELDKISEGDIKAPNKELQDGDEVIGLLEDPEAKKIYEVRSRVIEKLEKLAKKIAHDQIDLAGKESSEDHDTATCPLCTLKGELLELGKTKEALDELWWVVVLFELSKSAKIKMDIDSNLGIREDWKIVLIQNERSFEYFLSELIRNGIVVNLANQ